MDTLEKLGGLRTELIELSFALERRGRLDAADVALETSHRIEEICEELSAANAGAWHPPSPPPAPDEPLTASRPFVT